MKSASMNTPWGRSQDIEDIADGIRSVSTASHGGIQLSKERQQQLPGHAGDNNYNKGLTWWEEDSDWCIPFLIFQNEFKAFYERTGQTWFESNLAMALKTAENYHPEFYAVFCTLHTQPELFGKAV